MGYFGKILGWVVSALVGGSLRTWVVSAASHLGQSLFKLKCMTNIIKCIDEWAFSSVTASKSVSLCV